MQQDLFGALCVLFIFLFGLISALWLYLRNFLDDNDINSTFLRCIFGLRRKQKPTLPHLKIARLPVDDFEPLKRTTIFSRLENFKEGIVSPFSNKHTSSASRTISPEVLDILAKWGGQPGHDYMTFNNGEYYNKINPALKQRSFMTRDFFLQPNLEKGPSEIRIHKQPSRRCSL